MKKWLAGCLISAMLVTNVSFAESIDVSFMDLAIHKISVLSETRKSTAKGILEIAMSTDEGLDTLKTNYDARLTDQEKDEMQSNGITDAMIQANIEKLKTWSVSDRMKLLEAGFSDNPDKARITILRLNSKNEKKKDKKKKKDKSNNGNKTIADEETPLGAVAIPDEETPLGAVDKKEIAKTKGLRAEIIEMKQQGKAKEYDDIQGHWSQNVMSFLIDAEIMAGKSNGKAAPDDTITKAEIVALTMRMFAPNALEGVAEGMDSEWYAKEKMAAEQLGVIAGAFEAGREPSRAEIVDMMVKVYEAYGLELPELDVDLTTYGDFATIPVEYQQSMKAAIKLGLIQGMGNGTLAADESITRAQLAVMLSNLYNLVNESVLLMDDQLVDQSE